MSRLVCTKPPFSQVSAQASDILLSPRGQAEANSQLKASTPSNNDPNLITNRPAGNAKAWELAQSFKKVPGTNNDINLAGASRPSLSPKNPGFEAAWRANAVRNYSVQVAPLK